MKTEIHLDYIEIGLIFKIAYKENTFEDKKDTFEANSEARYQIKEGYFYEYEFSDPKYSLKSDNLIVTESSFLKNHGRISPNTYVGTLTIPILKNGIEIKEPIELEVQSIKTTYREDYRFMLEEITEKTTDLLLQANSPTSHSFTQDPNEKNETLYQKFAFVKSIINSDEFKDAVQKVISSPVSKWIEESELTDVRKIKKFGNKEIRQLINSNNRMKLLDTHPLYNESRGIKSIASKIYSNKKKESVDTSENQFIKHALESFLKFCIDIESHKEAEERLKREAKQLIFKLEDDLQNNFFKEISIPTILELNSPALQRKEGYRHILKVWLMFDLAAKLMWHGGDDIYKAGKRNVATLYEYWLFFKLLDLLSETFYIKQKNIKELIQETKDGLGLQLREGKEISALEGFYENPIRNLNIKFTYNRTFSKSKYKDSGTWSIQMRPDYTLSIWPKDLSEKDAEEKEEIVHIHFDAKYKIANINQIINNEISLDSIKKEEKKGIYKNADLLKMHAYKDAIRRTSGAYVLYPGDLASKLEGFHEVLPGLGAFPIRPSLNNNGLKELKEFIKKVKNHFLNRASQRENLAIKSFDIHKNKPNSLKSKIPEGLIPDDTFVLVGYCKGEEHYKWIKSKNLYNFRTNNLTLDYETVGARYLLLYTIEKDSRNKIFKIVKNSMKIYSQQELLNQEYPLKPSQDYYMVFELDKVNNSEFINIQWDISKLKKFKKHLGFKPFVVTLTELMKMKL